MATEQDLELAARCLSALVAGRTVRGAAIVAGDLDLCLFFDGPLPGGHNALRVATGGPARARLGLETVRLARADHLAGDVSRLLAARLPGHVLRSVRRCAGERRVELRFGTAAGEDLTLVAECFGTRGNWFVLDPEGTILGLARLLHGARGDLRPGTPYRPPPVPAAAPAGSLATPADPAAWIDRQAARFAEVDRGLRLDAVAMRLGRDLRRERKGTGARILGLEARRTAELRAGEIRREAELLLSQPDLRRRGLTSIEVRDWYADGALRRVELDPRHSIEANAELRFRRARRLAQGTAHTAEQLAGARARLARLDDLDDRLRDARARDDEAALDLLAVEVAGIARRPRAALRPKQRKEAGRRPYLAFESTEGFPIWVGRTRQDNDTLTLQLARGNDVWLHAAGGTGGSHVVIRLDRGKTASLETLLDAATLALHFSKARGRPGGEVVYTQRKHVRKPRGFPPGKVEVLRSKTLQVRVEAERLRRLLGDGGRGS